MSRWTIDIQCSNCGAREEVPNALDEIGKISERWGSFGGALYCPDCVKTWDERNDKPLASKEHTFRLIAHKFFYRVLADKFMEDFCQ